MKKPALLQWLERGTSLHMLIVKPHVEPVELDGQNRTELVRSLQVVSRVKEPGDISTGMELGQIEAGIIQTMRKPSEQEIVDGIRYAVWPVALIVIIP